MAASELAISLVINSSLHMLSEGKILSHGLRDRIDMAVNDLRKLLITLKLPESGTDNDQQSSDHECRLLDRARDAVYIADKFLLEASQHLMSHKGHLTKIHALVHCMSLRIRVGATEKMALDFITSVEKLSTHLSQKQDPPPRDLLNLDDNASSRNGHRGNVRWNGKVESDIVGREDEVDKLLVQLTLNDGDQLRLRIVSVVGEEAIGKTALVRSVYNRLEIAHSFHCRIWVHLPEEFTLKDVLVKMLKQTPLQELKDLEHLEQENIKEILHKSLMELRYLIVFDNLHDAGVMDELMILLADSRNGSRVIITTRDPEIPSYIDPWASPLKLNELDADQSKRLLRECGSVAEDPGLTRFLSKCSGSPPTILLLGGLAVVCGVSFPDIVEQHADNPTLHDIMCLSYRKLPSLLKPCLLYLCLFPKDSEISTRRLFQLWLAEGLVQVHGFTAMECFEELAGRNLVRVVRCRKLSGRPKSCRVPSFLHDFLCEMAMRLRLLQILSNTKCTCHSKESKVVNRCSWIVKYQDNNYHPEFQHSTETEDHQHGCFQLQRLRSYISFNTQKREIYSREVEEFFQPLMAKGDSGMLRVLDLEGIYKPLLPDGLGNVLPNLRYLGLRRTALNSIPESVGNMSHLETLDLKHTNVRNLPSSIWKVKSLQHLYMNEECFDNSIYCRKPSAKCLCNLQTLWGLYIGAANSPMLNVLSRLTRLEKLGLKCNSPVVVKKVTKHISNFTMLQSLKLISGDFSSAPLDLFGLPLDQIVQASDLNLSNMTGLESLSVLYLVGRLPKLDSLMLLPPNLKILTLSLSDLVQDPMPVLGMLQRLEILNLFARSYTGQEFYCGAGSFPSLRVLKLWKLEGVEEAYVQETALCCLEELEIKSCGLLTVFASLDHIQSLKRISLIKVKKELATNIKESLTGQVFIKEMQLVTSSFSSAQATEESDKEWV